MNQNAKSVSDTLLYTGTQTNCATCLHQPPSAFPDHDAMYSDEFDFGLLDTVPMNLDLLGDDCFDHSLDGDQFPTSALNNPCATHESLPFCQQADVATFDSSTSVLAPIEYGQNPSLGNVAFSDPVWEQYE